MNASRFNHFAQRFPPIVVVVVVQGKSGVKAEGKFNFSNLFYLCVVRWKQSYGISRVEMFVAEEILLLFIGRERS